MADNTPERPTPERNDATRGSRTNPNTPRTNTSRTTPSRSGTPQKNTTSSGQRRTSERSTQRRDNATNDRTKDRRDTPGQRSSNRSAPTNKPGRRDDWKRPSDDQRPRSEQQARYDGPPIPDDITGKELDRQVAGQLKGLPEKLANRIARHLAAAQDIIDTDPTTAYHHTLAARARASRLAIVREACGEAAYAAGEYGEALSELRAAKRMNGATAYLPIMADCERALGRPERALTLAKSPAITNFTPEAKAEMTIVEAGARRDLGDHDAALRTLENAPLNSNTRAPWVTRLRYTYADTLQAAGRTNDALEWFHRTEAIDTDETTDAATRAHQLEHPPT